MPDTSIIERILNQEINIDSLVQEVIEHGELIPEILNGTSARSARIKYTCAKILSAVSEKEPKLLYPLFDKFVELLDSENSIITWNAIQIVANLTVVDIENKFERVFEKYFSPIPGPVLITAANTIKGAAVIAQSKPELSKRIVKELLKVENACYKTVECRNIALGHLIQSVDRFYKHIPRKTALHNVIKKQQQNSRDATRKKAEKFCNKHEL